MLVVCDWGVTSKKTGFNLSVEIIEGLLSKSTLKTLSEIRWKTWKGLS